ncbi:nuclear transport factor 2 family protein [Acidiphilium sp.]|uniref:nuclear transport factor 2 family protein n=1 Tax=Acidiphilium sp. TaxID=527 RepID=UPI003CFD3B0F
MTTSDPVPDDPIDIVREFWRLMATNDFHSVNGVLAAEFVLDWPQSGERIRGGHNFASMNAEYPAKGAWCFTVNRIIGQHEEVVSDVSVTDGVQSARAISFFTLSGGKIIKIVEFWPENFEPSPSREKFTERLM